jgi:hypothetical protein
MFPRQQPSLIIESLPVLAYLIAIGGFCFAFGGFIHWLLQPVVLPNPGLAAYQPPPATRLEPLVRNFNVQELSLVAGAVETDPIEPAGTIATPAPELGVAPVEKAPATSELVIACAVRFPVL